MVNANKPRTPQQPIPPEVDYDVEGEEDSDDIESYIDSITPEMLQNQQRMSSRIDSKGTTFKWVDGLNKIRLCPAKKGVGYSYFAARQHWLNVPRDDGKMMAKSFLCIAPTGKVCPICEYAASLAADPASAEEGKRMEARPVYIYNVIDMNDPEGGPKIAFFPWEAHKSISELWEAGEDPTDFQNGPVFSVKREKRGRVTYTTTPLSARYVIPLATLKALHDLRKYSVIPSAETLQIAVDQSTGALPPGAQTTYTPGMPAARQQLGSRALAATTVAPPRRNLSSMARDE